MRSNYPFNCWYVAATTDEIGQGLLARRLLDKPVVMYRCGSGDVVAMEDRCVHRAYPLSAGRRDGDRVVCGYHGFAYDPDGCLVDVPSQENVPPGARVRTYPVYEQSPFVWIWLGDPGMAALRPPPRVPWYADGTGWGTTTEVLRVEANYLLLHEHYLDLTDVFVMHPEVVPPDIEVLPQLDEVEVSERSVSYSRTTPPSRLAAWEAEITGLTVDATGTRREEGTFVSPALHVQHYVIAPDGRKSTSNSCGFRDLHLNRLKRLMSFCRWPAILRTTTARSPSFSGACSTSGRFGIPLCWRRFSIASARRPCLGATST